MEIPYHSEVYTIESGRYDGSGLEASSPFESVIGVENAEWLQLVFADHDLGNGSWITLRSLEDGGLQKLDARSMKEWSLHSAYFNGDAVELVLHVAPDDRGIFVNIGAVIVGDPARRAAMSEEEAAAAKAICGATDDRVPSGDNRVCRARPSGCTAWRVTNGAFLTAGHCVDLDPDNAGPLLPDGALDTLTVVEFNVPLSDSNGGIVNAAPQDQYPVNNMNIQWRFDGTGQGLGKDWAVFGVYANSTTGLLPHQAYGFPFRMTKETPAANALLQVTGFGVDSLPSGTPGPFNQFNMTNQTTTGTYTAEQSSGQDIWITHRVDTEGGNSGSPMIWDANGLTIGIHTNGGCTAGGGNNAATSFEVDALENALMAFPGANTRYVDSGHPMPVVEDGFVYRPFNTIPEGVNLVPVGGNVSVVAGWYVVSTNYFTNKAMTITAPVGEVLITAP
jgi:V8-like Glu-specific endopeptidase